ncbi:MAG: extracellular solute-binding protein [Oscillospiraceae bacterium]|nr:extracellular solute-binding protein [Oscillospiraceae bacterium]
MKKELSIFIALSLILGLLCGCGSGTAPQSAEEPAAEQSVQEEASGLPEQPPAAVEAPVPEGSAAESAVEQMEEEPEWETISYPLDTDVSFSWYMSYPGIMDNFCEHPFDDYVAWKEWQERTGVRIEWELTSDIAAEAFQLRLASGDPTDVFMSALATSVTVDEMIDSGMILELHDLIQENMPDYMRYADEYPDFAESLGTESTEGNWGGLHKYSINSATTAGLVIRDDWLQQLGLEAPETYDELHDVLLAFRSEMGATDPLWINYTGFLPASCLAAGFDNIGCPNGRGFPVYQVDGTVKFGPQEEGFREYIRLMADWYAEGLIYRDFVSYTSSDSQPPSDLIANGKCGVFSQTLDSFHQYDESAEGFSIRGIPDIRREKEQSLHFVSAPMGVSNIVLCVSSACENPEVVLQAFNYDFTEEGILLMNYGVEGESFEYDESGTPQLTDAVLHSFLPDVSLALCYYTGTDMNAYCGVTDNARNWMFYDDAQMGASKMWENKGTDDTAYNFPALCSMNTEETEQYNTYISDLNTYIFECALRWITGGEDVDDAWEGYLSTLESMGVEKVVAAEQLALDRYNENSGM